ncbi:MAG TPA: biotin/lipoyl-containing protein [Candidatus Bathyarchaeia archaeon]|nr:biotin/lipoyl-containing protein [Candidatus Bathyarchaeia archaeon]
MDKKFRVRIHGTELDLEQSKKGIKIKDYYFKPEVLYNGKFYRVFVNGREYRVEYKDNTIHVDGKEIDFDFRSAPQLLARNDLKFRKGADIKASIPGKIVEVRVNLGDQVQDQQCVVVLESMKMRNEILSPIDGIVEKIFVNDGDQVSTKQLLVKIKPME